MKTFNFLFIISAFFIIGCAPDLDFEIGGGEGDTHISGKVTDLNTGEPIDSVKFVMRASQFMGMSTWYPISDTTDSTGNFEF
jgi:hypothetical protein